MAKRSGKQSGSAPRITPRRQAAIDAYTKAHGRAPKRSMSIKDMNAKVAQSERSRQYQADKMRIVREMDKGLGARPTPLASGSGQQRATTSETVPRTKGMTKQQRVEALRKHASGRATWGMSSPERSLAQAQENRFTFGRDRPPSEPGRVFHQVGVTNDAAMGHAASSSVSSPSMMDRAKSAMPSGQTVGRALTATGVAVAAGRGYQEAKAEGKTTGEAVVAGAMNATPAVAIAAAPAIARGAGHVAEGMFAISGALFREAGSFTDIVTNFAIGKAALGTGAVGVAAKGVELAAKGVSRVAMPALAAYSAYQGARESQAKGENMTIGAARGVVRAFDPSAIFMRRGVGERAFDAGVNAVSRMSSGQQKAFAQANANYSVAHMGHESGTSYEVGAGKRGFGNPVNQAAAQRAKGNKYEGLSN